MLPVLPAPAMSACAAVVPRPEVITAIATATIHLALTIGQTGKPLLGDGLKAMVDWIDPFFPLKPGTIAGTALWAITLYLAYWPRVQRYTDWL